MKRLKAGEGSEAAAVAASRARGEELQFVVFRLGDEEFGLPIGAVSEVARVPDQITRLPKTPKFLEGAAGVVGQGDRARRLTRSLLADPGRAERELRWSARVPIDQAIEEVVRDYRARRPH